MIPSGDEHAEESKPIAYWLPKTLKELHEMNKYKVLLTLRQRGLGQLNRDMSLSNKAGKLQNGHLKRPETEEGEKDRW